MVWDVERTHVWYCRSREEVEGMRRFLLGVLMNLCGEGRNFVYVQGFHCIVRAMFEMGLSEREAVLFGSYLLRDIKLERLYANRLQRIRELCYALDVYIFNNLP
ncbi:unnamed protein product [Sphagnum balticum]